MCADTYIYWHMYIYALWVCACVYARVCDPRSLQGSSQVLALLVPHGGHFDFIANCPDFKQMHNIRTTKNWGQTASLTETTSVPTAAPETELASEESRF